MAKKKFLNLNKLVLAIIGLTILAGVFILVKEKTNTPNSPLPTIFPNQPVEIPNDWKTNSDNSSFPISYKYPNNWYFKQHSQSGIPNYGTFHSNDNSQCIAFSLGISSGTLDEGIRSLVSNSILSKDTIVSSQEFTTLYGYPALIEEIKFNGKRYPTEAQNHFYSGNVDLGPDKQDPGTSLRKGVVLSSCSINEKDTLIKILNSIKLN